MLTIKPTICYKNREVKAWNDIMFRWVALSRLSGVVSDLQPSFVLSGQCVIVRL